MVGPTEGARVVEVSPRPRSSSRATLVRLIPKDLILPALLAVALGLPLPLLAWGVCWRRRSSRAVLGAWLCAAALLGYGLLAAWLLAGVEETGQHSSEAGLARFAYIFGLGACQAVALALVALPALLLQGRRSARVGAGPVRARRS